MSCHELLHIIKVASELLVWHLQTITGDNNCVCVCMERHCLLTTYMNTSRFICSPHKTFVAVVKNSRPTESTYHIP